MTSSADKERARRAAIEAAWVRPDPLVPAHAPEADERPRNALAVLNAIRGHGFEVQEFAAINYTLPSWGRINPDDIHLSFTSDTITVYKLGAKRLDAKEGELAAIEVNYLGGVVTRSCLGYGPPRENGHWLPVRVPITQLAKTIREALA